MTSWCTSFVSQHFRFWRESTLIVGWLRSGIVIKALLFITSPYVLLCCLSGHLFCIMSHDHMVWIGQEAPDDSGLFVQAVLIISQHTQLSNRLSGCGHVLSSKHRWLGLFAWTHCSGHDCVWWWDPDKVFIFFANIPAWTNYRNHLVNAKGTTDRETINWVMCSHAIIYQQILACSSCHQVSGSE